MHPLWISERLVVTNRKIAFREMWPWNYAICVFGTMLIVWCWLTVCVSVGLHLYANDASNAGKEAELERTLRLFLVCVMLISISGFILFAFLLLMVVLISPWALQMGNAAKRFSRICLGDFASFRIRFWWMCRHPD